LFAPQTVTITFEPTLTDPFAYSIGAAGPVTFEVPVVPADHREQDELHQLRAGGIAGKVTRTAEVFAKISPP
jgi:hypothetical protein